MVQIRAHRGLGTRKTHLVLDPNSPQPRETDKFSEFRVWGIFVSFFLLKLKVLIIIRLVKIFDLFCHFLFYNLSGSCNSFKNIASSPQFTGPPSPTGQLSSTCSPSFTCPQVSMHLCAVSQIYPVAIF